MRRSRLWPASESRINAISTTVLTDTAKVRTGSSGVRLAPKANPITIHIKLPERHQQNSEPRQ